MKIPQNARLVGQWKCYDVALPEHVLEGGEQGEEGLQHRQQPAVSRRDRDQTHLHSVPEKRRNL